MASVGQIELRSGHFLEYDGSHGPVRTAGFQIERFSREKTWVYFFFQFTNLVSLLEFLESCLGF